MSNNEKTINIFEENSKILEENEQPLGQMLFNEEGSYFHYTAEEMAKFKDMTKFLDEELQQFVLAVIRVPDEHGWIYLDLARTTWKLHTMRYKKPVYEQSLALETAIKGLAKVCICFRPVPYEFKRYQWVIFKTLADMLQNKYESFDLINMDTLLAALAMAGCR